MYKNFMAFALEEAKIAFAAGEVPVGAVIVRDGEIVARAHNRTESGKNALLHAEMIAIDAAIKKLSAARLSDCDLYVTMEPCPMCAGAILNARINRLYYGATDPISGCCGSKYNVFSGGCLNHNVEIYHEIMTDECTALVKKFFKGLRG